MLPSWLKYGNMALPLIQSNKGKIIRRWGCCRPPSTTWLAGYLSPSSLRVILTANCSARVGCCFLYHPLSLWQLQCFTVVWWFYCCNILYIMLWPRDSIMMWPTLRVLLSSTLIWLLLRYNHSVSVQQFCHSGNLLLLTLHTLTEKFTYFAWQPALTNIQLLFKSRSPFMESAA